MQKNLRGLAGYLSIMGILSIVNPAAMGADGAESDTTAYCGKKPTQSCRDFASTLNWVLRTGDLRPNAYADRRAQELKLPANGAFVKSHGAADNPDNIDRAFNIIFDKEPAAPGARPVCVLVQMVFPDAGNVGKESYLRFKLDGKADIAVDAESQNDEKGNPIKSSAVYHPLKLNKPEVKALVEKELAFWVKHAKEMSAKDAGAPQKDAVKDQPAETSAPSQDQSK